MESKIKTLLETPDNIELIRDSICGILKVECLAQYEKAKGRPDEADYRIGVWRDKSRPWQLNEDSEKKYPFPLVNVMLIGFDPDIPIGAQFGSKKYTANFYLDCYARGEFESNEPDDTDAALKAWKIGRVIRNIIMSEHHAYFGERTLVRAYRITNGKTGDPRNIENSAQTVTICRLTLTVDYFEDAPMVEGIQWKYGFIMTSPEGEVLIDVAGEPGVNKDKEGHV